MCSSPQPFSGRIFFQWTWPDLTGQPRRAHRRPAGRRPATGRLPALAPGALPLVGRCGAAACERSRVLRCSHAPGPVLPWTPLWPSPRPGVQTPLHVALWSAPGGCRARRPTSLPRACTGPCPQLTFQSMVAKKGWRLISSTPSLPAPATRTRQRVSSSTTASAVGRRRPRGRLKYATTLPGPCREGSSGNRCAGSHFESGSALG